MTAESATTGDVNLRVAVRGAGGLVIRRGPDGAVRVALVHRPRQDDWTFPKGKQRRGETLLNAAVREVRSATGFLCSVEEGLGVIEYLDRRDRPKLVRYWAMNRLAGTFQPGKEADAIAWLRPAEAELRLTHERDRFLLVRSVPALDAVLDRREHAETLSLG